MNGKTWALVIAGLATTVAWSGSAFSQTQDEIDAARHKGLEFIRSKQDTDGSWPYEGHNAGITALCTLALLENGAAPYDPVVDKGYRYVRRQATTVKDTYDITLSILLLARLGERQDRNLIRGLGARLLAGQTHSGGWTYSCPPAELSILADVRKIAKKEGYGDNSNTQFAVLGLWVASRYGVPIEDAMIAVARRFTEAQNDDGGWGYTDTAEAATTRPSMTCAGLFSLTVARATRLRQQQREKAANPRRGEKEVLLNDPVFSKGFERVGNQAKGIHPSWPRYTLWSFERLGVLLGLETLGETDWYRVGADALLKTQKDDGSWPDAFGKNGLSDTSFALLFLRKANLGSDISRIMAGEPEKVFQIINRDDQPRFETIQDALQESRAGDVIRIDGNGPFKLSHDAIDRDLTIQAGLGYDPVFELQIGISPEGLRYRPEKDPRAQHLLQISGGNVVLEGLRLQMDPPITSTPVPWKSVYVTGGNLRMLNCSVSETNRRGTTNVVIDAPGEHSIRNCLIVGGTAAIQLQNPNEQMLTVENSILFCNTGILFSNHPESKETADTKVVLTQSTLNGVEAFNAADFRGTVHIDSALCVYKCDAIGLNFLAVANRPADRTWQGLNNVYNVANWVGAGGKKGPVADPKAWSKFWGDTDKDNSKLAITFSQPRRNGVFGHGLAPQDWDFSEKSELAQSTVRYGVRASMIGSGEGFSRYREDFQYGEWKKGNRQPLVTAETGLK
jgi:hypothetical protein